MTAGCNHGNANFDGASPAYRRALWVVIAINAIMFGVEMTAGMTARSQALQADALDFLADSLTNALSLAVIGMSLGMRARAALVKAVSLSLMGLWVFGATAYRVFVLGVPEAAVMGLVGLLALVANMASVFILLSYRNGDSNVRSVWLCSRNDAIGNVAVMVAAAGVWGTGTPWPDLTVAAVMAGLFLYSSVHIIRQSLGELNRAKDAGAPAE